MSAARRALATAQTFVVLVGLTLAACDSSSDAAPRPTGSAVVSAGPGPTEPPEVVALRARPLRLPVVAASGVCPATQPVPLEPGPPVGHPLSTGADPSALGAAPVFPDARYFDVDSRLPVRTGDEPGWFAAKVPWGSRIGYRGWVLIRIGRVDGRGEGRLTLQERGSGQNIAGESVSVEVRADWEFWPGSTQVSGPGCYAYQVDGYAFTDVIVFRAEVEVA